MKSFGENTFTRGLVIPTARAGRRKNRWISPSPWCCWKSGSSKWPWRRSRDWTSPKAPQKSWKTSSRPALNSSAGWQSTMSATASSVCLSRRRTRVWWFFDFPLFRGLYRLMRCFNVSVAWLMANAIYIYISYSGLKLMHFIYLLFNIIVLCFINSISIVPTDPSQPPSSSSSSSLPHQKTYAHRLECLSGEIGRLLCQPFSQSISDETRQALVIGTKFDGRCVDACVERIFV